MQHDKVTIKRNDERRRALLALRLSLAAGLVIVADLFSPVTGVTAGQLALPALLFVGVHVALYGLTDPRDDLWAIIAGAADAAFITAVLARSGGVESPLWLVAGGLLTATWLLGTRVEGGVSMVGLAVGTLSMHGPFDSRLLHTFGVLAIGILVAYIEKVRAGELSRTQAEADALADLGVELQGASSLQEVLAVLTHKANADIGFARAVALVPSTDTTWLMVDNDRRETILDLVGHPIDEVIWRAWRDGSPIFLRGLAPSNTLLDFALPFGRNVVVVPLLGDGEAMGVLVAEWDGPLHASVVRHAVNVLEQVCIEVALTIRNVSLMNDFEHLASRDSLTSIANRRIFEERLSLELARAEREGTSLTVVMLDLDDFKTINDDHGHQAGDDALREVARALKATARAVDLPARYGGDEFIVLLPGCSSKEALVTGDRFRLAVGSSDSEIPVTASAGVATFPTHAVTAEELIGAADQALYAAKDAGRNRIERTKARPRRKVASARAESKVRD